MKVMIAGAGIGGLTTALWPHHVGVERRAPGGFTSLGDVIDPAKLKAVVSGYARASGSGVRKNRAGISGSSHP